MLLPTENTWTYLRFACFLKERELRVITTRKGTIFYNKELVDHPIELHYNKRFLSRVFVFTFTAYHRTYPGL